ncbi:hypothetical protein FS837_005960 [Tulasnella sp. UAMH 9824]|nr:hypothetical protein FS837_005960 [Tulasnella sp. UAMH 9824]
MSATNQSFPQDTKPPVYTVPENNTSASFVPDQKYEPIQVAARFILQTGTPEGVAGPSSTAALEVVDPDSKSPIDEPPTGFIQPPPAFFIKRQGFRPYALYEGREPPKEHLDEGRLLDISDEGGTGALRKVFGLLTTAAVGGFIGWVKTDSYYAEAGGLARTARMYKMKDDDKNRNSWFSSARTLEDFQGTKYKFDTTVLMNNLTIINLSENKSGVNVIIYRQGTLEIQQAITLKFLHLLLGACYIKYLTDQRR